MRTVLKALLVMIYLGVGFGLHVFVQRCSGERLSSWPTALLVFSWPVPMAGAITDLALAGWSGRTPPRKRCVWETIDDTSRLDF